MRIALIVVIVAVLGVAVRFWMMGRESQRMSPRLGQENGQFQACPSSPNCVSSDATDEGHKAPIWTLATGANFDQVARLVAAMPATRVMSQTDDYLHAEVSSSLFGFVDDLELALRDGKLAVRSASRVGYSDLGANRKRVQALEERLRDEGVIR